MVSNDKTAPYTGVVRTGTANGKFAFTWRVTDNYRNTRTYTRTVVADNKAPTVSCDFNHDPHSSTFDVTQTQVLDKRFVRVMSWYDNEWGFSNRMVEVANYFGSMH